MSARWITLAFVVIFFGEFHLSALSITNLYSFSALLNDPGPNADGSAPRGAVVSSGGLLYGTTAGGGAYSAGTIFALDPKEPADSRLTILYDFPSPPTNGSGSSAALVSSGNTLYGTARAGGTNGLGTVFSISTSGTNFAVLHQFGCASRDKAGPLVCALTR